MVAPLPYPNRPGGDANREECDEAVQAGGTDCEALAAAAGITVERLLQLNTGLDCSALLGDVVCVSRVGKWHVSTQRAGTCQGTCRGCLGWTGSQSGGPA